MLGSSRGRLCARDRGGRALRAIVVALLVSVSASPARADGPDAREQAAARFQRALEAAQRGRLSEAAREFEAAYALSPSPIVLYNLGQTQSALGRPVEAAQSLRRYLETETAPLEPDRAQEVKDLIAMNERLIGTLALQVTPPPQELEVDAALVAPNAATIPLAAGRHVVVARRSGYSSGSVTVDVTPGAQVSAALTLEPLASAAPPPTSSATPFPVLPVPAPAPEPLERSPAALAVSWASMGVGAVALGVGAGFGISAINLNKQSKIDGHCDDRGCDTVGAPLRAAAVTNGNVATALLITGAALVGAGLTVYLVTAPTAPKRKRDARLTLAGRPGSSMDLNLTLGF